ncbi:MAG: hypothetical protein WAL50_09300, partial [Kineosporiaceae bacterium]
LAPEVAAEMDARRQRASAILRTSGWAVTDAGPQDAVPPTWHRAVASGSPAAAFTPAGAGR